MNLNRGFNVITLLDREKWDYICNDLCNSDIYFTSDYHSLAQENKEGVAHLAYYLNEGMMLFYPFLQNDINSLGFDLDRIYSDIQSIYGYSGPISNTDDKVHIASFYKEFRNYVNDQHIVTEFMRFNPILNNHMLAEESVSVIDDRKTVAINLKFPYDQVFKESYSSKNRNIVRKGRLNEYKVTFTIMPDEEQIEGFIKLYHSTMQKAGASMYYYFDKNYFINLFKCSQTVLCSVINKDGQLIGSCILLQHKKLLHYHLSARHSDADNSVTNFMIDECVSYGQKNNMELLHLGGGRTSADDDTLLKFKKSFSSTLLNFKIGKKIYNQTVYNEIIAQWESTNPGSTNKNLQRYRIL